MSVRYHIVHETEYLYANTVSVSRQALHLAPRVLEWQRCYRHELRVEPVATFRVDEIDSFGNPLTRLEIDTPHARLLVATTLEVEVDARPDAGQLLPSIVWEQAVANLGYIGGRVPSAGQLEAARYRCESPFVPFLDVLYAYALDTFGSGVPTLAGATALMHRIHRDFLYDTTATHIATPLAEVFNRRRGVCQDFAHLMVGCLRAIGVPARYVSGYLLTNPPPGTQRLIGADASHAWVSVWCADNGWVDFDPTNDQLAGLAHITLAWGRDFGDVSPLRGIIIGGGDHELQVRVTVSPQS